MQSGRKREMTMELLAGVLVAAFFGVCMYEYARKLPEPEPKEPMTEREAVRWMDHPRELL
jgi:hypothetical protein